MSHKELSENFNVPEAWGFNKKEVDAYYAGGVQALHAVNERMGKLHDQGILTGEAAKAVMKEVGVVINQVVRNDD